MQQRLKDIIAGKKAKKRKLEEDSKSDQGATSSTNSKASSESVENKDIENGEESESVDHLTVEDIISETKDTSEKHSLVQIFTGRSEKIIDDKRCFKRASKRVMAYLL